MTTLNYCRLCVNIGLDFKSLYDEHGHANEVYELTTKYFDSSILNIDEAKYLTMICLQCWEHIWDFNNFQQAVHVAQSNLDAVKQLEIQTPTDSNATKDRTVYEHHKTPTTDKKEDYICLSESEESEAAINTQIEANDIESLEKNDGELTKVDLTLDEDAALSNVDTDEVADEEFDDPVGVFIGGEFTNENEVIPQPDLELFDIDSDSNLNFDEYSSNIETPETLSACETDNNSTNITQRGGQSSNCSNLAQEAFSDKSKQKLECAICSESCYRYYILQEHFNRMHPSENIQSLCCNRKHTGIKAISEHLMSHNGPIVLTCDLCGKNYVRLHYLKRHIITHHPGEDKQLSNISSSLLNENYDPKIQQWSRNNYPCNECGKNTTSFFSLRRHVWLYHQAKHKHKCEICNRTFKTTIELREHMTSHTGENLYTCPHCQQQFKVRARYYEHQKREHGNQTE